MCFLDVTFLLLKSFTYVTDDIHEFSELSPRRWKTNFQQYICVTCGGRGVVGLQDEVLSGESQAGVLAQHEVLVGGDWGVSLGVFHQFHSTHND